MSFQGIHCQLFTDFPSVTRVALSPWSPGRRVTRPKRDRIVLLARLATRLKLYSKPNRKKNEENMILWLAAAGSRLLSRFSGVFPTTCSVYLALSMHLHNVGRAMPHQSVLSLSIIFRGKAHFKRDTLCSRTL